MPTHLDSDIDIMMQHKGGSGLWLRYDKQVVQTAESRSVNRSLHGLLHRTTGFRRPDVRYAKNVLNGLRIGKVMVEFQLPLRMLKQLREIVSNNILMFLNDFPVLKLVQNRPKIVADSLSLGTLVQHQ